MLKMDANTLLHFCHKVVCKRGRGGGVFLGAYDICVPHGSSTADLLRNWIPSCTMGAVM